jgi:hypothetical protein
VPGDGAKVVPPGFEVPGQPKLPRCPAHSMIAMGYKWVYTPEGESVLACIKPACVACGAVVNFNYPDVPPKKADPIGSQPEK